MKKAAWAVPGAGAEPEVQAAVPKVEAELQELPGAEVQQRELLLRVLLLVLLQREPLRERAGVQAELPAGELVEPELRELRKTCRIHRRKQRHRGFPYRN